MVKNCTKVRWFIGLVRMVFWSIFVGNHDNGGWVYVYVDYNNEAPKCTNEHHSIWFFLSLEIHLLHTLNARESHTHTGCDPTTVRFTVSSVHITNSLGIKNVHIHNVLYIHSEKERKKLVDYCCLVKMLWFIKMLKVLFALSALAYLFFFLRHRRSFVHHTRRTSGIYISYGGFNE